MNRVIPNPEAQHALMALTGKQISQAELQRLQGWIEAGEPDAVGKTYRFFKLHSDALEHCGQYKSGLAAQAAYDRYCFGHGREFGY